MPLVNPYPFPRPALCLSCLTKLPAQPSFTTAETTRPRPGSHFSRIVLFSQHLTLAERAIIITVGKFSSGFAGVPALESINWTQDLKPSQ